jgi:Fuc2NAc and GlcNAc transferase
MQSAVLVLLTFVASVLGTAGVRKYALSERILDRPNERSSHAEPIPRGGGLAIVLGWSMALCLMYVAGILSARLFSALALGGTAVAWIGWRDDRHSVSPTIRLLVHFGAAVLVMWAIQGLPALRLFGLVAPLGITGSLIGVLIVVWGINLYNFMDGIDGLAAGECVVACAGMTALTVAVGGLWLLPAILGAAAAGFLVWNWPPAKIFMGDVGSGFLGFALFSLALASERSGGPSLLSWIIVLGAFCGDATLTLLRRAVRRERLHVAHRHHAYQRLVKVGYSHREVTLGALGIACISGATLIAGRATGRGEAVAALITFLMLALAFTYVERQSPM